MTRLLPQQQQRLVQVRCTAPCRRCPRPSVWAGPWGVEGVRVLQASVSRALRRLEHHDLLQRLPSTTHRARASGLDREPPAAPHHRTTHVALPPDGLTVAQWVTAAGGGGG